MQAPKVLMIFLDGVGVGIKDPSVNPFYAAHLPTFSNLLGRQLPHKRMTGFETSNVTFKKLDANLGVAGLPQSGTGQTALLCGVNASKMIGKHFGPYPYSLLRKIIEEKNLFIDLRKIGKKIFYANAYPQRYFDYVEQHQNRRTATTLAYKVSGFHLNDYTKLKNREALASDITNERWNAMGFQAVSEITLSQAGKHLVGFLDKYDFVFYEYFFTDHAGHSQSMDKCKGELEKVDGLLSGILENFDMKSTLLIITSDHGNIEDLRTKSHTRNPVPLILVGAAEKRNVFKNVKSISQIAVPLISLYV
jgi:2,3-bisphosphoglycerate-independent phosphoglycerate mutase